MLKVLDFTRQLIGTITDYDDLTIDKTIEDGDEKISFSYLGDTQIPAEGYVQTDRARYTIKEVEPGDDSTEYRGQLDLEDLQRVPFKEFSSTGQTLQATAAAALANTGWIVSVDSSISGVRNVRRIKKTPLEILYAIRDAWMCEIRFDNLNNTVYFADQIGEDRGVYLMRGLNLIKLRPVYDSYDYVTRIIPYGADGLTIEEVNEGIPYVENYQYSTKILTLIWEDTEYEDAQALKEDAIKKLADLSKPKTAYSCEVLALAKMQTKYSVLDYDLGDTVRLYDAMLGVDEKQRIVRYVEHPDAPEQDTCEISNTILTFEQLQAKYEAAANAWEDVSNGDGTVNGVYVHGVQADDVVGIETVISENALVQAGVTNVIVEYAQGDSPTEAPESGWSPTAPEWDSGKYMWQRTRLRHASGTEEQTAETNITGATGKGVAQQIAYYALGSTDEYPPVVEGFLLTEDEQDLVTENGLQIELELAWTTDVPERHDGEFIWMFMRTVYSDGTYSDTDKVCLTGDKGDTGSQGIQGPPGEDGVSLYTWLKYADTPTSGMSDDPDGKDYIGLAYNKTSPTESSDYDDYTWSLVKGEQGDQGIPGPAGDDGESLYTWLKYANDASGSGMSDDPTGKDYIGLAYNKTTQTESQNPQDYIWSKIKGETGATGVGIASVIEYYAKSASTTAPADSQFSTSIQTIDEVNRYLWNYEVITYTDNTTERTGKRIIGVYGLTGPQGAQGVSITGVTNYYLATAASSGVTPDTPGWTTSVQNVTSTNKYLWNYEVVSFSSGSPSATNPCIIGSYGDKGDKGDTGDTGDTGVSISSVTNYYLATSASSGVTPSTPGWTTSIQTMTSTNQYLWNYEVVTGDNGSTISSTSPCIIGRYGQDGSPGAAGKGISSITEYYQVSTSNTTAPTTWETTVPTTDETNRYLWNYEHIVYTDSSTTDSAKRVIGTHGAKGDPGSPGTPGAPGSPGESIDHVTNYYLATSASSGVTPSTSGWTTTVQTMTATNQYLWNYEVIYGDQGSTIGTTVPCIIGRYGQDGAPGSPGTPGTPGEDGRGIVSITEYYQVSSSNTEAPTTWTTTVPNTDETNRYLWNYEHITYTKGSATDTEKRVIGTHGARGPQGVTGETGAAGRGIATEIAEYAVAPPGSIPTNETEIGTEDGSEVLCEDGTNMQLETIWSQQMPSKPDLWFAWMRIHTTYSDSTWSLTNPAMISGADAVSIEEQKDQWYLSTSNTTQTGGSWQDNPPQYIKGRYYWKRTVTTWTDGSVDTSAPVLDYTVQCATTALDSANGKTVNFYQSEQPSSVDRTVGDTWFKLGTDDDASNIIAIYKWNGAAWDPQEMTSGVFAYIDAGAITTGTLSAIKIDAVEIEGDGIRTEKTTFTDLDNFNGSTNEGYQRARRGIIGGSYYTSANHQADLEGDGLKLHAEYVNSDDTPGTDPHEADYDIYPWAEGVRMDGSIMVDGAGYFDDNIYASGGELPADSLVIGGYTDGGEGSTPQWYGTGGSEPAWWPLLGRATAESDQATLNEVLEAIADNMVPEDSPAFTGTPTAPTARDGTNTTQIATTAFVHTAVEDKVTYEWVTGTVGQVISYARKHGIVFVKIDSGGSGINVPANTDTTIGTLPSGYRPWTKIEFALSTKGASAAIRATIDTDGVIKVYSTVTTTYYAGFVSFPKIDS